MFINLLSNLGFYVPELICIFLMCILLFIESTYKNEQERTFLKITALIGLAATFIVLVSNLSLQPVAIFSNAVVIDQFSTFIKIILVFGTLGAILINQISNEVSSDLKAEFIILSIGILIGGMLLASSNNMLVLYLGVETLSILSYVMAALRKEDAISTEAGIKYALYGGITAGIMLFGISHIYGIVGSIQFSDISVFLQNAKGINLWLFFASFILFFSGVGYKVACVPFHMWSPDVYQGSPMAVTSFFSIVPKFAGIAVIMRISMSFFGSSQDAKIIYMLFIQLIAALTMTVGNVSAIGQDSVKRLLAYSSIGHVGMILLGVVVMDSIGVRAILFYSVAYLFMTIAAFLITAHIANKYGADTHSAFKGLIVKHPFIGISMVIVLFSLAGLPPFAGFVAKFNILNVVIQNKLYALAFIAAINSVISLYFYMRLVKFIVFEKSEYEEKIGSLNFLNQGSIIAVTLPILVLGIFWESIMSISEHAPIFLK